MVSVAIPAYATKKGAEKTGELLEKKLGYNFLDLITKLVLFYSISFVISKYMEARYLFSRWITNSSRVFWNKVSSI